MLRLALLIALVAGPAQAQTAGQSQARISEADVRAFVGRQQATWNRGDLDRYFATFSPDARFTDQAYVGDKPPVLYGTSTLAEARAQSRRSRARSREAVEVLRIRIAADGRSAEVFARVGSVVETEGKTRRLCASRTQTLTLSAGRLRSGGQTDTFVKCRGG